MLLRSVSGVRREAVVYGAGIACWLLAASAAYCADGWSTTVPAATGEVRSDAKLSHVRPGLSTKAQVQSLLGAPWRVVQFNDCGMSMPGQADETCDYRGKDSHGAFRLHIEFDDHGVADLVAKVPEHVVGGKGTAVRLEDGHESEKEARGERVAGMEEYPCPLT